MSVAGKRDFSSKTLLGNWFEQRLENESYSFQKGGNSQHANQLTQFEKKLSHHLQACKLSDCSKSVKYGDKIMLSCLHNESVLSTDGQEKLLILNDECRLATASSAHTKPVLRNTFQILPLSLSIFLHNMYHCHVCFVF